LGVVVSDVYSQDNKRQTSPHPNKQINNKTQDNKRQKPPSPNIQIKNTTQDNKHLLLICLFGCGGLRRLLSSVVILICLFGCGGV
jgi:hypothetical protein